MNIGQLRLSLGHFNVRMHIIGDYVPNKVYFYRIITRTKTTSYEDTLSQKTWQRFERNPFERSIIRENYADKPINQVG